MLVRSSPISPEQLDVSLRLSHVGHSIVWWGSSSTSSLDGIFVFQRELWLETPLFDLLTKPVPISESIDDTLFFI